MRRIPSKGFTLLPLQRSSGQKGFTLLELLIVIGILAVLAAVTVVVLNPAQLLKRARDSRRISDLKAVKTAISFYTVETSTSYLGAGNLNTGCMGAPRTLSAICWKTAVPSNPTAGCTAASTSISGAVDTTGWIPVNLASVSGGSPLSNYPIDPTNAGGGAASPSTFYSYNCATTTLQFMLIANMESDFYKTGGSQSVEDKDGGLNTTLYEVGTAVDLVLAATSTAWYPNH